jgi:hypothetical protein
MTKPVRTRSVRSSTPSRRWFLILLLFLLLAVAVTWPFVNIGPRGATILVITHEHGVDVVDLAALVPLTLALALALAFLRPGAARRRDDHRMRRTAYMRSPGK